MPDDSDPPRKFYELAPRSFERANPPRHGGEPGFHPPEPQQPAAESRRIDVTELNRQAMPSGPVLSQTGSRRRENDLHGMLRDNHARETAAGLHDVAYRPRRKSRRLRDFILILVVANTLLTVLAIKGFHAGGPSGSVLFVSSIAAIGLITSATTWIMFFVMDDY